MHVLVAVVALTVVAQPPLRYQMDADLNGFPQTTAKQALASVVKALDRKRYDYLLAHLCDPDYVDARVKLYGGKFEEVVRETVTKFADNADYLKELSHFLKDGEWEETANQATVRLKDVPTRQVFLRKIGDRWYLENRQK